MSGGKLSVISNRIGAADFELNPNPARSVSRLKADVSARAVPFHHTRSSKLWTTLKSDGNVSNHRDTTTSIRLSGDFFDALQSAEFRQLAGQILISSYFEHAEQVALYELAGIEPPSEITPVDKLTSDADEASRTTGRTARFRVDVVAAYCHTCALTGYRITTITGHSIVDAAHIHQFAKSHNDDLQNGIALCKNAHCLFDLGLWSIDADYHVIVAKNAVDEDCPTQQSLASLHGRQLNLPRDQQLWPIESNLAWHREKRFVG